MGCGESSRGGGTAGPWGEVDSERAGEEGEYHHSKNLMKNIAVGSRTFSESSNIRGEDANARRRAARMPPEGFVGDFVTRFNKR